jgi:hypothetical protein
MLYILSYIFALGILSYSLFFFCSHPSTSCTRVAGSHGGGRATHQKIVAPFNCFTFILFSCRRFLKLKGYKIDYMWCSF